MGILRWPPFGSHEVITMLRHQLMFLTAKKIFTLYLPSGVHFNAFVLELRSAALPSPQRPRKRFVINRVKFI